jgi:predicted alpha/beta-fold hydrolase
MDSDIPMILVGFSMGANTLVKLLGEYGVSKINQLPKNVIGAVSIGNPLKIHDNGIKKPLLSHAVRLGVKKTLFKHRKQIMKNPDFKNKFKELLFSSTLNEMTSLRIGNMHRNENVFPFANKIGYNSVQEYWDDASSYKYISNVPIPLVVAFADDDDIANTHTKSYMNYGLSNPNVIFVSTASGGHLGYHHARYNNPFGSWNFSNGDGDWGSMLILKFADVVIRKKFHHESVGNQHFNRRMMLNDTLEQAKILKSRL